MWINRPKRLNTNNFHTHVQRFFFLKTECRKNYICRRPHGSSRAALNCFCHCMCFAYFTVESNFSHVYVAMSGQSSFIEEGLRAMSTHKVWLLNVRTLCACSYCKLPWNISANGKKQITRLYMAFKISFKPLFIRNTLTIGQVADIASKTFA